jgi:hypothetical protein
MTYGEMITVGNGAYDLLSDVADASELLRGTWARFFLNGEPLQPGEAREVGLILGACVDKIENALLRYWLAIGLDVPQTRAFFEDAEAAKNAQELVRMVDAVRGLDGVPGGEPSPRLSAVMDLPPELAIPALRDMLNKGGDSLE